MSEMNRRGFFGLLAAVALLPKRAVGQLEYTSYTFVGKSHRAGRMISRPVNKGLHDFRWAEKIA